MDDSLANNDPSEPAVDQIAGVVRHLEKGDQGVVSACQEDERNQVHSRHDAASAKDNA